MNWDQASVDNFPEEHLPHKDIKEFLYSKLGGGLMDTLHKLFEEIPEFSFFDNLADLCTEGKRGIGVFKQISLALNIFIRN